MDVAAQLRFARLVHGNRQLVWRTLRRLGVDEGDTDDATQEVFLAALRKLEAIRPRSVRKHIAEPQAASR